MSNSSETLILITALKLIDASPKCPPVQLSKDSKKILLKNNNKLPNISQNSKKITIFGTLLTLSFKAR
jgi:hypothetical protein